MKKIKKIKSFFSFLVFLQKNLYKLFSCRRTSYKYLAGLQDKYWLIIRLFARVWVAGIIDTVNPALFLLFPLWPVHRWPYLGKKCL